MKMKKRTRFCSCLLLLSLLLALALPAQAQEGKYVALTLDDGPSGRFTSRLLEGLEQRNVKATFFLCGYRMELYPELTQLIVEKGHEVGLHGFTHDSMAEMSESKLHKELEDTAALLFKFSGLKATLLRPPGGSITKLVRGEAEKQKLSIVTWSVDPKDWATIEAKTITRRVVEDTCPGDVILLHDMSDSSVDAALAIVDQLTQEGYTFVTVSRLAELTQTDLEWGKVYSAFSMEIR